MLLTALCLLSAEIGVFGAQADKAELQQPIPDVWHLDATGISFWFPTSAAGKEDSARG